MNVLVLLMILVAAVRGAPVGTTIEALATTIDAGANAADATHTSSSSSSVNKDDPDGILPTESANGVMDGDMIAGSTDAKLPTSGSKCSVGCGVGIGIGCLAGLLILAFIFVMARRHKRKLHNLWQHRRWMARQKALPDKPMPAPPPPLKH
ncbi:hypothetical protein LPJ72_002733 [Coemansia sp. Benny D160-2]|nr:hypothetical protein LPJ72_002733 [Coemansia sp. Benny D160-2]